MNRRNKRTSLNQYTYFLDTMEANPRLAANTLTRQHYAKKWKEMSVELNKCPVGPKLSAEDWRKRLNDWKNTTRSKYRRSIAAGDSGSCMNALETRALHIFCMIPSSLQPAESDEFSEYNGEHQEEEEELVEEMYQELEPAEEHAADLLINRVEQNFRLQNPVSVVYEVESILPTTTSEMEESVSSFGKQIQDQIKRLSDIHEATLHFKIARFKYKNPGFEYYSQNI